MEITISKLKDQYDIICSCTLGDDPRSVQDRANIIRLLEIVSHSDFKDTQDFHVKVGNFFLKHVDVACTLPVYDNFIGTDPLVAKSMLIWAEKKKSLTKKLIPLKDQG